MISARQMADAGDGPQSRAAKGGDLLRRARASISAGLVCVAELVEDAPPGHGGPAQGPSVRLDAAARRRVAESLEGELSDMLEDAAKREMTEQGAKALLLTADIVRWLREGEDLPGDGAIGLLEIHVAIFNGAPHEDERRSQRDLLAVLLALVDAQASEIHGGRWRHKRVNVEAAEAGERRRFGDNLDRLRESRGLSIGELATAADLEVLTLVELIYAARYARSSEIRVLAQALEVETNALFPDLDDGGPVEGGHDEAAGGDDGPPRDEPGG
jgi:hypothetical protein